MFDCFPNYKLLNVNLKEKIGVEGVYLFLNERKYQEEG